MRQTSRVGKHAPGPNRSAEQVYDELLVLRCQDGDRPAFAELVKRWQGRLFGHALQLTGRRDAAQDAVQETWLAIVRQLSRIDDPAHFAGFAHRILARRCADWTRGQSRRRRLRDEVSAARGPQRSASTAERDSDAERIREALSRLPTDRRVVVALHYLHDLSVAEIASMLDLPSGTVKSRLHAARVQLRAGLSRGSLQDGAPLTRREPCPS